MDIYAKLAALESFDWDEGNINKNRLKHGISSQEAEEVFANSPLLVSEDAKHSAHEDRFNALGVTDEGKGLHITFTVRGNKIRVISARPMDRQERRTYEKEKAETNT